MLRERGLLPWFVLPSHWSNVLLQSDQKKDGDEQGHGHPEHKDDNRNQSVHWYPADDEVALTNHGESHRCELRRTRRMAQG